MTDGVVVTANVENYSSSGLTLGVVATANISCYSFLFNVVYGTIVVIMQNCPETGAATLVYYMTAWDEDGVQYVYWETENQYLYPVATQPVAIGTLTDFRIQAKRIA